MSACNECGSPTQMNFPLCNVCWKQRKAGMRQTAPKGPAHRPALSEDSPLDVDCTYALCNARAGAPCEIGMIPDWSQIRVVALGTWRVEVHEARFRLWRSQPVKLS